jgi:hypothetical protein
MGTAVNCKFEGCECLGTNGQNINIPAGIWPVAELDIVSVYINGRVLELNNSAFQGLKLERKAVPIA